MYTLALVLSCLACEGYQGSADDVLMTSQKKAVTARWYHPSKAAALATTLLAFNPAGGVGHGCRVTGRSSGAAGVEARPQPTMKEINEEEIDRRDVMLAGMGMFLLINAQFLFNWKEDEETARQDGFRQVLDTDEEDDVTQSTSESSSPPGGITPWLWEVLCETGVSRFDTLSECSL
mmetsp:Transcript_14809/g.26468  ORF Transcript_14809/g.26468 Transcript_14809/m.26468 type:complete len:177 (+) Transcript_14809:42-572(+)